MKNEKDATSIANVFRFVKGGDAGLLMQGRLRAGLLAAMLLALASPVRADIIYSNLFDHPNLNFGSAAIAFGGGLVGPLGTSLTLDMAMPFTVSSQLDFSLTQIEMALEVSPFSHPNAPFPAEVTVRLLEDSGGLPGTMVPLAQWLLEAQSYHDHTDVISPAQTIAGISGIVLEGGSRYWLAASVVDPFVQIRWWDNATNQLDGRAHSTNSGNTWSLSNGVVLLGAFEVEGTPVVAVPEPGTLSLLMAGLLGSLAMRGRPRQRQSTRC